MRLADDVPEESPAFGEHLQAAFAHHVQRRVEGVDAELVERSPLGGFHQGGVQPDRQAERHALLPVGFIEEVAEGQALYLFVFRFVPEVARPLRARQQPVVAPQVRPFAIGPSRFLQRLLDLLPAGTLGHASDNQTQQVMLLIILQNAMQHAPIRDGLMGRLLWHGAILL